MLKKFFYHKNIGCAYLFFYIHFAVEIICFYYLSTVLNRSLTIWLIPFIYDAFAFVPQALIGHYTDRHPKVKIGYLGIIFLILALIIKNLNCHFLLPLLLLCFGNAIMHICGATITLKVSNGHLSHSSIFVAGGSFGVIIGKILGDLNINYFFIILIALTIIPFYYLSLTYHEEKSDFNYTNKNINPFIIILSATIIVIIRGYIGYGIPTSWNKTIIENIIFYFTLGIGKAFGGILADFFGFRKIALISTILSIPFLCFGNTIMIVSLLGIMLFSMTMSLTLGLLASTLKNNFGLAFGITTIGLFLGTAPIFFIKIDNFVINIILITISSIICFILLMLISRKEDKI